MTVENFVRIVWTVFEKFEIIMKGREKKKQKKRHDCISSRNFFRLPKIGNPVPESGTLKSGKNPDPEIR